MNTRHRLIYIIVKNTSLSKHEVKLALAAGRVKLNTKICFTNELVGPYDSVFIDDNCLINGARFVYYKFYKPRGIECTLNTNIPDSLVNLLGSEHKHLFYVGRLDKASEGLLLLTNDGHVYNKIIDPKHHINKQYLVQLESEISADFISQMENGVKILGTQTLPCQVDWVDSKTILIMLTQGLNRQIRRMCFALNNYVTDLKRLSIGQITLGDLNIGEIKALDQTEIFWLKNLN